MNRRAFLKLLSGLPFLGFLSPAPVEIGEYVNTFWDNLTCTGDITEGALRGAYETMGPGFLCIDGMYMIK